MSGNITLIGPPPVPQFEGKAAKFEAIMAILVVVLIILLILNFLKPFWMPCVKSCIGCKKQKEETIQVIKV